MSEVQGFLDVVLNFSKYHREHEKYYARAPLRSAMALHEASQALKIIAERWCSVQVTAPAGKNPYMGCEDLNEPVAIRHNGVLFMEGEGELPEIAHLKRDLGTIADDFGEMGQWLERAMAASWQAALPLLQVPALAGVLGERHRIIVNNWQAAQQSMLVATLIRRSLEIVDRVDFTPVAVRVDLAGPCVFPKYLSAASEIIDRAVDVLTDSVSLTHDNDRRWRVFCEQVQEVAGADLEPTGSHDGVRWEQNGSRSEVET